MAPDIVVHRLEPGADPSLYRDIRLDALRLAPEAFGSALSEERDRALEWFSERLTRSEVFGAFVHGELVGTATFLAETREKVAHRGSVFGVYVRPTARGTGVGRRLMKAVISAARGRVD